LASYPERSSSVAAIKKAGFLSFVFVMYSYTTAGPFGLEDQVTTSGPGMTLIYHLVLPFFWCIPISLVAAELTTAIPVEGGFYRWTRMSFGDFWGFLAGWWNWCASFLMASAYAVLFSDYLSFWFPSVVGWKHYLISVALIAVIAWINVRGIKLVGAVATVLEIAILIPVVVMCLMAIPKWHHNPFVPIIPPGKPVFQVFGVGLALGLWLYSGFEQLSTIANEVENPQKAYPRALAWVVPLSIATYFLPTLLALAALGNWEQWHTRYFSDAALSIGGPWLALAMTAAAAITNVALFNSTVLTTTPMPSAMAEDGYMSPFLARKHSKYGTPANAIIFSSIVYALLATNSLIQLISLYTWFRIATSILTVLSAWKLRRSAPAMARPFRIPWGKTGLVYAVTAPILMSLVSLVASDKFALWWGPPAMLSGPLAYLIFRRRNSSAVVGAGKV
jgi:amino acid transporter